MIAVVALRPGLKSVNNAVKLISMKYSANGVGSYDSQVGIFRMWIIEPDSRKDSL